MTDMHTGRKASPLPLEQLDAESQAVLASLPGQGLKGANAPVNVLGTLMHNQSYLARFLDYWVSTKRHAKLSYREQEIIILRMGFHYRSDYVWGHHVPAGLESGLTAQEIDALADPQPYAQFSEREALLIQATDESVLERRLTQATWAKLEALLDNGEILDWIHVISQYVLYALVNNTFAVELEPGIVGLPEKVAGR